LVLQTATSLMTTKKAGAPTKHKLEYNEQAYKLCLLGATDKALADFFDTSEQTINAWKKNAPQFLESLKAGKALANANVAKSLYQNAIGYTCKETKVLANPKDPKDPVLIEIDKHYPPNSTSAIFFLKNRERELWKDVHKVEHSGEIGITFDLNYGLIEDAKEIVKDTANVIEGELDE